MHRSRFNLLRSGWKLALTLCGYAANVSRRIFDQRMADGTRHFACLPAVADPGEGPWHRLKRALEAAPGVTLTKFVTDDVTEAWLDFEFRGHQFSANNQFDEWWLFVQEPSCPPEILAALHDRLELGLREGPVLAGRFRVVIYEADGRVTICDHDDLAAARAHADDAASETEDGVVIAVVFDDRFEPVHRGTHYALRR